MLQQEEAVADELALRDLYSESPSDTGRTIASEYPSCTEASELRFQPK